MKLRKFSSSLVPLGMVVIFAAAGTGCGSIAAAAEPQATESNIARLTADVLEESQFEHRAFDDTAAAALFDRYLDSLDPSRTLFLQSDVRELGRYRAGLARGMREHGDTAAARAIFARYLERLAQRASFIANALRTQTFSFTGHDAYAFDREDAPRPADAAAAEALWLQQLRAEYLQEKLEHTDPLHIATTLTNRYAGQVRSMKSLHGDDVLEIYLDALTHVYDPHSDYLGHEQMESFGIAMNLSLFGIGATLESTNGYCTIRDLVPGGPAAKSGLLKPGDRIVSVVQPGREPVDLVNVPIGRAVEFIRGPKGSRVTLHVIPAGASDGAAPEAVTLVRDEVKLQDEEAKAKIIDLPTEHGTVRLGVIDLPSFYAGASTPGGGAQRSATADVARLLQKLEAEHVQGVALDLRKNGGGSLEEAIGLTGLFIRKGPVVQTRDPSGRVAVDDDDDALVAYDGPLVVLTSRLTASASEIVAGALQDYGRAVVVGDSSTFGKGTVQTILPLAAVMDRAGLKHAYDPGALKITISKFYRPSGASTQLRGVASDVVIPSSTELLGDISESAMKNPLPWDVVPASSYDRLNRVTPYVAELRADSERRIATQKEFADFAADLAAEKAKIAVKAVSLNEAERAHELADDNAHRQARAREDAADAASRATVYQVTLENASRPGLPPPLGRTQKDTSGASEAEKQALGDLSRADRIVLDEGTRVLADYVELLGRPSGNPNQRSESRSASSPFAIEQAR